MHHVQKRAIIAIISMIESGLREIRAVLTDGQTHTEDEPSKPAPLPYRHDGPLSDAEEETLEKMMEHSRLTLEQGAHELASRAYSNQGDILPTDILPEDFFEEGDL